MNIDDLYQELILDHGINPRNFFSMEKTLYKAEGYNSLCGDRLYIYVDLFGDYINKVSFTGSGCAISIASASIMTDILSNCNLNESLIIFDIFFNMLISNNYNNYDLSRKLIAFSGIKFYPTRVKCATLCWHAFRKSINV